jgi:phage shock protein A
MGILGRINTVIKSNVNEVLDKMTNPAKEIDLLVYDMEKNLKQAKQEVITSTATAKRTGMRCKELEDEVETWGKRAGQAVRAGDDNLAREALQEKISIAKELEASDTISQEQLSYVAQLKSSLKALEARVKEVKLRKESLKARATAAKEGYSGLKQPKAFEDFNRMEDKIEAMASEADLTDSLDAKDAATNAKFAQLEAEQPDQKVEDALAELKRKMDE